MGKGDKRTRKGKIYRGSYGKRRPHKKGSKVKIAVKSVKKPVTAKKTKQ
jgi:30S ribosomal protein S31